MKNLTLLITTFLAVLAFSNTTFAGAKAVEKGVSKVKVQEINKLDLNKANVKEIASSLKGVGMKKAAAIVEYRKVHGDFKSIEELASVKGISVKTIAKNQAKILLK